jgi:hypothetical protein
VNWVLEKWNSLSFDLPSATIPVPGKGSENDIKIGGGTLSTPDVPLLAAGGVLTRATLNVAGEAGPEAVIPLDRLATMMDREYAAGQGAAAVRNSGPERFVLALDGEGRETLTGYVHRAADAVVEAGHQWGASRTRAGAFA